MDQSIAPSSHIDNREVDPDFSLTILGSQEMCACIIRHLDQSLLYKALYSLGDNSARESSLLHKLTPGDAVSSLTPSGTLIYSAIGQSDDDQEYLEL